MKDSLRIILFLTFIMLVACEKSDLLVVDDNDKLLGFWVNPVQVDGNTKYERADSFQEDQYGFAFIPHQKFVERRSVGDCATPPLSYGNYYGTYNMTTDSIIIITMDYSWGSTNNFRWKIVSIDDEYLVIDRLRED